MVGTQSVTSNQVKVYNLLHETMTNAGLSSMRFNEIISLLKDVYSWEYTKSSNTLLTMSRKGFLEKVGRGLYTLNTEFAFLLDMDVNVSDRGTTSSENKGVLQSNEIEYNQDVVDTLVSGGSPSGLSLASFDLVVALHSQIRDHLDALAENRGNVLLKREVPDILDFYAESAKLIGKCKNGDLDELQSEMLCFISKSSELVSNLAKRKKVVKSKDL